jgi:RhtB (resistance to homoserine/threonine) family protein
MDARTLAFLGISALLTITPGADMAIVTRTALSRGRRAAFLTTLGINTGVLVWAFASALGLAALLVTSATAYATLKLVGAAYLIWLGVQTIWQTRPRDTSAPDDRARVETRSPGEGFAAYRQGLLTNLLNPKVGLFYTTFLPQFIAPGEPVLVTSVLLGTLHNLMGFVWLIGYAYVVTRAGDLLRRPDIKRAIDGLTGVVLIALGFRLAVQEE